ncbi:MAG TPA: hypothetical protein VLE02_01810 [Nitrosarchaeum sp.]|nr:hypothetical protein [Nitrosarchaeum sp.]
MNRFIDKKIEFFKMHDGAQTPKKASIYSNWDLYLVSRQDGNTEDTYGEVTKFGTGLQLTIPEGYVGHIVSKSNLASLGYVMATGVQLVYPNNSSEIEISLIKNKNTDDIELPAAVVELSLIPSVKVHLSQTSVRKEREENGEFGHFGSEVEYVKPQPPQKRTAAKSRKPTLKEKHTSLF